MNFDKLDYEKLVKSILTLQKKHRLTEVYSVGKSVEGRELLCIKFGRGNKKIFLNGAHHALEWITSSLLMGFSFDFLNAVENRKRPFGYDVNRIYENVTFYVMPMVNPDGVNVVINGLDIKNEYHQAIYEMLDGKNVKKVWQANIHGVDLNHNYDASFYKGKTLEIENGVFGAGPTRFSGEKPFSEPETIAVRDLFEKELFNLSLAFHSQGEVIYWDYYHKSKYLDMAKRLSEVSGYELDEAGGISSVSGFKDWVIDKYELPAFTVEVGKGVNPISFSQFCKVKKDNTRLILEAASIIS